VYYGSEINKTTGNDGEESDMAWIKMVDHDDADDYLLSLYKKVGTPDGDVDHILKIHSLQPRSLEDHYKLYKNLMRGRSGLSRIQREMIAVVVSAVNNCHY
jgi:alkylhydroperoxidase family enzyme